LWIYQTRFALGRPELPRQRRSSAGSIRAMSCAGFSNQAGSPLRPHMWRERRSHKNLAPSPLIVPLIRAATDAKCDPKPLFLLIVLPHGEEAPAIYGGAPSRTMGAAGPWPPHPSRRVDSRQGPTIDALRMRRNGAPSLWKKQITSAAPCGIAARVVCTRGRVDAARRARRSAPL
jgi:hypothetical protein